MTVEMENDDSECIVTINKLLSPLIELKVEPVGRWYHAYKLRHITGRGTSLGYSGTEESGSEEVGNVEIEDDIDYLRSLNPLDWKSQDHYAVLGLKNYRSKASDECIKKAYRVKVLRHHPDKRKAAGEDVREDDDYFTCITKAYEILGVPQKRKSYDSVDPEFDDSIPGISAYNKANFFKVFMPCFERNAKWAKTINIPSLGKLDDDKETVDKFYTFWYEFDSWREFSYLDEEEKEKGADREERRWIEKQNKAERAQRKKKEMARIRRLVDAAYTCDPRIAKFKEEEKERKMAQKRARQEAIRQKIEEKEKVQREIEEYERLKKEEEEAEQRAKVEAERKEKEATKKALKKERKSLRGLCKDHSYYTSNRDEQVKIMADVEYLCEALDVVSLDELNKSLAEVSKDLEKGKELLFSEVHRLKGKLEEEQMRTISSTGKASSDSQSTSKGKDWSQNDLQLLIKAVNLFPAGTNKRWDVVTEYINQHSTSDVKRVTRDILTKAKELQHSDQQIREVAVKNAFQPSEKSNFSLSSEVASQRFETPQEMLGFNTSAWTNEEQRLLEQALKTYPPSTPDRWDCIAVCIPNRSKKDCMKRYRELVEMVKAKKAAKEAADAKK